MIQFQQQTRYKQELVKTNKHYQQMNTFTQLQQTYSFRKQQNRMNSAKFEDNIQLVNGIFSFCQPSPLDRILKPSYVSYQSNNANKSQQVQQKPEIIQNCQKSISDYGDTIKRQFSINLSPAFINKSLLKNNGCQIENIRQPLSQIKKQKNMQNESMQINSKHCFYNSSKSSSLRQSKIIQILTEQPSFKYQAQFSQHTDKNIQNKQNNSLNIQQIQDCKSKQIRKSKCKLNWESYQINNLTKIVDDLYGRAIQNKIQLNVQNQLWKNTGRYQLYANKIVSQMLTNNKQIKKVQNNKDIQFKSPQIIKNTVMEQKNKLNIFQNQQASKCYVTKHENNVNERHIVIQIQKLKQQDKNKSLCQLANDQCNDTCLQSTQRITIDVLPQQDVQQHSCKQDINDQQQPWKIGNSEINFVDTKQHKSQKMHKSQIKMERSSYENYAKTTQKSKDIITKKIDDLKNVQIYRSLRFQQIMNSKDQQKLQKAKKKHKQQGQQSIKEFQQKEYTKILPITHQQSKKVIKICNKSKQNEQTSSSKGVYQKILSQYTTARLLQISKRQYGQLDNKQKNWSIQKGKKSSSQPHGNQTSLRKAKNLKQRTAHTYLDNRHQNQKQPKNKESQKRIQSLDKNIKQNTKQIGHLVNTNEKNILQSKAIKKLGLCSIGDKFEAKDKKFGIQTQRSCTLKHKRDRF